MTFVPMLKALCRKGISGIGCKSALKVGLIDTSERDGLVLVVNLEMSLLMRLSCFGVWAPMWGIVGEVGWMQLGRVKGMEEISLTTRRRREMKSCS